MSADGREVDGGARVPRWVGLLVVLVLVATASAGVGGFLPVPGCGFKQWTGWPCGFCGGTRALDALGRGRIAEAFSWNPFVVVAAFGAVVYPVLPRGGWGGKLGTPRLWGMLFLAGWGWMLARGG